MYTLDNFFLIFDIIFSLFDDRPQVTLQYEKEKVENCEIVFLYDVTPPKKTIWNLSIKISSMSPKSITDGEKEMVTKSACRAGGTHAIVKTSKIQGALSSYIIDIDVYSNFNRLNEI